MNWTIIETITIPAEQTRSWPDANPPEQRELPYGQAWPTAMLKQGTLLCFHIMAVGSAAPGADLTVVLET
jgi:hypothetical protein